MADENPARPVPPAGKEAPIEPAPSTDTVYTAPSYGGAKRRRTFIILIAVVVLLVGGFFLWRYFNSYESTDDAQADVHLYPVSARISGYVIRVNVEDNQWVEKGTVLVEVDPKDYEVAVAQAQANLSNAEATRPTRRSSGQRCARAGRSASLQVAGGQARSGRADL